eukprot:11663216-Alexandrium_andersonii.AAC.1
MALLTKLTQPSSAHQTTLQWSIGKWHISTHRLTTPGPTSCGHTTRQKPAEHPTPSWQSTATSVHRDNRPCNWCGGILQLPSDCACGGGHSIRASCCRSPSHSSTASPGRHAMPCNRTRTAAPTASELTPPTGQCPA